MTKIEESNTAGDLGTREDFFFNFSMTRGCNADDKYQWFANFVRIFFPVSISKRASCCGRHAHTCVQIGISPTSAPGVRHLGTRAIQKSRTFFILYAKLFCFI